MDENKKTGQKDVFMHLLVIMFLYTCVVSFGGLMFQYINLYVPDALEPVTYRSLGESLRWPLSVLIIVFPFFVWLSWFLQKDLVQNPEKRTLKTRKWLLYFTLFVTTLIIVGDLISLIFRFLGGELTNRFLLKILTILVIAVAVFVYYLWNLRKDIPPSADSRMRWFVRGVLVLVGVAVIAGFFVAGSPQSERLRRFDDHRINDLQTLQWQIVNYWQIKEKLPQALSELRDDINGFLPPVDPETKASYEYRITAKQSFELCAIFRASSKDMAMAISMPVKPMSVGGIEENWAHDIGHVCFSRTIDPDRFPPHSREKNL